MVQQQFGREQEGVGQGDRTVELLGQHHTQAEGACERVRDVKGVTVDRDDQHARVRPAEIAGLDPGYDGGSSSDEDAVGGGSASADTETSNASGGAAPAVRSGEVGLASASRPDPHVPFYLRPEVMLKPMEELLANMHLDPQSGFPRPLGLQAGYKLFNTSSRLSRAWTAPPHVHGGQRIASFRRFGPDVCLGRVEEVYHSDLFTTALVKLDDAVRGEAPNYERAFINVWTSRNKNGVHTGIPFCAFKHPLDDLDVME